MYARRIRETAVVGRHFVAVASLIRVVRDECAGERSVLASAKERRESGKINTLANHDFR